MKVLIVSDTHGMDRNLKKILDSVGVIDLLIHLGDFEGSAEYIRFIAPCPVEMVAGNNDFFYRLPREKILQVGKYKILITHGHSYGVNYSYKYIKKAAIDKKVDIVMFGHTHVPMIISEDNIWIINPGSISYPRQKGRIPTFIVMDIDSNGDAHFSLNQV